MSLGASLGCVMGRLPAPGYDEILVDHMGRRTPNGQCRMIPAYGCQKVPPPSARSCGVPVHRELARGGWRRLTVVVVDVSAPPTGSALPHPLVEGRFEVFRTSRHSKRSERQLDCPGRSRRPWAHTQTPDHGLVWVGATCEVGLGWRLDRPPRPALPYGMTNRNDRRPTPSPRVSPGRCVTLSPKPMVADAND